jgi:hypothetical protein
MAVGNAFIAVGHVTQSNGEHQICETESPRRDIFQVAQEAQKAEADIGDRGFHGGTRILLFESYY